MSEYLEKQVVIIGGGSAGLACACALRKAGIEDILILEREKKTGGILKQCIHDGFGLTRFGETLSGPEYSQRFIDEADRLGIPCITGATVTGLTGDRLVTAATRNGLLQVRAGAVVLSMGCREKPRGALSIPGDRPSGVFTAGVAQSYMNLYNSMVGKHAVILGSGDIGMIMARRLTLEGAKVEAVFEILPYPSGLPRNIEQCLNDYGIPLYLSHTVTRINGRTRLESVTVSETNPETLQAIPGTEKEWPCDTLILSCGLIPENELSRMAGVEIDPRTRGAVTDEYGQTSVPGIFAAGNVLHVHDLVDFVSLEAEKLADGIRKYLQEGSLPNCPVRVETGPAVGYTVPQKISGKQDVSLSFRPRRPRRDCVFEAIQDGQVIASKKVRNALPAVMLHMEIPGKSFCSGNSVKVVARDD